MCFDVDGNEIRYRLRLPGPGQARTTRRLRAKKHGMDEDDGGTGCLHDNAEMGSIAGIISRRV
jgi:hypothetical protein